MELKPTSVYRSNVVPPRDITHHFKHAVEIDQSIFSNSQRHKVLCDPRFSYQCGYATHDEAALLWAIAHMWHEPDNYGQWLEIGSHTAWTACHLAMSGCAVVGLDPEYERCVFNMTGKPSVFLDAAEANVRACDLYDLVFLVGMTSEQYFNENFNDERFVGVFVDGNHDGSNPTDDALRAVQLMDDPSNAIVVFHDAIGSSVQQAIETLCRKHKFNHKTYLTPQLLTVCYRGNNFQLPEHTHDHEFDWCRWLKSNKVPKWLVQL